MVDILNSLYRLWRKLKNRLRGRHKPERTRANPTGERVDPSGSLPQQGPRVIAGGDQDGEGTTRASTVGRQVRSKDQSPQPGSIPADGSNDNRQREAKIDGEEISQGHSRQDPEVEVAAGSGPSLEVERIRPPLSTPLLPPSEEPDNNAVTSVVPGHVPDGVRPNKNAGPSAVPNENRSNWRSTASATAGLLLRGVRDSADAFGPLKSVAGGLYFILENCERTKANKQAIESLIPRVKALAETLCAPVPENDVKERERRQRLERKLEDVCRDLAPLEEQGKVEGFFNNFENAGKLSGLVEDIRDAMMEYQTSLQQDIYESSFLLIESAELALLDRMRHTSDAGYRCGNRQGCLRGTRKDVLWEIEQWLTGEGNQRVFWLNGLAGTGKSTIAQTFAETTFADGKLGASFFCSRDFADQSNLQAIFPTLAFQLAYQYPHFRKELLQVLKARPDVGQESLCSQMEKLIVGPLKATHISTLIIIDALDECKDEEPASAMLSMLSRYADEIPEVKFFITGRPEPPIRSGFRLESLRPITEVLRLHDVQRSLVDSDIKLFFRTRLSDIAKTRSDCDFTQDWPGSSNIDILCEKAAGLFIYASTVIKFIASRNRMPAEQLDRIISLPQNTAHEGRSGVDLLYTQVLEQSVADVADDEDDKEIYTRRFKAVVGAVVLMFNPLPVKALSDLLGASNISTTLRSLHSLLLVPEGTEDPIRTFHKSFPDFLTDPKRCKDQQFYVEPTVRHVEILLSCLKLMGRKLKKNICNLDDYAVLTEVDDLTTHQKDHIGDALEYACCFWTKHLLEVPSASSCAEEVQRAIDHFFTTHLLHWIEALALTGNLVTGVHVINDVEQWYISAGALCKWAKDSQHFLLEHFDMINHSPSHIYHSALPFSPSSSWLHKGYSVELAQEVKVVKGLPTEWGICSRTVSMDSCPLALSYWSNTVAIGSKDGDIIILDTITGTQTAVLSGHTDEVNSLTFSSDGKLLVSGSNDETVKLWDVQTGGAIKTFYGHTSYVCSVSISADCTRIASGSLDHKVHLWDIQTGECNHVIEQQKPVYYVNFSPKSSQQLLSVCNNKVLQWNISGQQVGPTYDGSHVAFSLDGTLFVLCNGAAVTVRNSSSGVIVAEFHLDYRKTHCCCFSPDGKLVAFASVGTAYVWDISSLDPNPIEILSGHTGCITSLVFSSSSSLISACYDQSVKFWQIHASDQAMSDPNSTLPIPAYVKSVALQAKDGITITGDSDGVMRIWDISTGHCKASFQTPAGEFHGGDVQLINGKLASVWYTDKRIDIWDAEKEVLLLTVEGPQWTIYNLRVSGDGSRIFCQGNKFIQAWSTQTGEVVSQVKIEGSGSTRPLIVDGLRVWIHCDDIGYQGWDFGTPGSSPTQLPNIPMLHLNDTLLWDPNQSRIKDAVTGKVVFQLPRRFGDLVYVQCNGCYLAACFNYHDLLILDFNHITLQ